jgi:uncharacterized protein YcfJ
MKKLSLTLALLLTATAACSQSQDEFTFVRVLHSQPVYTVAYVNFPDTRCYSVNVPVYSQRNSGSGDVFTGMIIGGLAGDAIGGNDRSAAIGAIIGGVIAAEPRSYVSGYRTEQQCETVYIQRAQEILDGYNVTYIHQNVSGVAFSPTYFQPGSLVSIRQLSTGR